MDTQTSLQTSFWVMMFLQTLGSVDVKNGPRKLPAPKAYVPVIIVWAGLQIVADTGRERAASTASWVMVLAGLVLGPAGQRLVGFFSSVANQYGATPVATTPTTTTVQV